jgi:hypothetical protein
MKGISYGEGDGIINNFVGLSNHGCSLCSFDKAHRESFIALQALTSFCSKTDALEFIAGDFNQWNPSSRPLQQDTKGTWKISLDLKPGKFEYRFLLDGEW